MVWCNNLCRIHFGAVHGARCRTSPLLCFSRSGRNEEEREAVTSAAKRRDVLLSCSFLPTLALVSGSDDAKTVFNSVLSAYGLPTMKGSQGYKVYDELSDDFYFEYPRSWVVVPNRLRAGVYISDYQAGSKRGSSFSLLGSCRRTNQFVMVAGAYSLCSGLALGCSSFPRPTSRVGCYEQSETFV